MKFLRNIFKKKTEPIQEPIRRVEYCTNCWQIKPVDQLHYLENLDCTCRKVLCRTCKSNYDKEYKEAMNTAIAIDTTRDINKSVSSDNAVCGSIYEIIYTRPDREGEPMYKYSFTLSKEIKTCNECPCYSSDNQITNNKCQLDNTLSVDYGQLRPKVCPLTDIEDREPIKNYIGG